MKTITIHFDEENKKVEIDLSAPTTYSDFIMLMLNSSITFARKVLEGTPEEHKHAVKGELYDLLNVCASNALHAFAPEFEIQHTAEEDAVLQEMEDFISEDTEYAPETVDATEELVEAVKEDEQITTIG